MNATNSADPVNALEVRSNLCVAYSPMSLIQLFQTDWETFSVRDCKWQAATQLSSAQRSPADTAHELQGSHFHWQGQRASDTAWKFYNRRSELNSGEVQEAAHTHRDGQCTEDHWYSACQLIALQQQLQVVVCTST